MPQRVQAKMKRPTTYLSNIIFSEGEVGKLQKERYLKFYECSVTPTRYTNEPCLRRLELLSSMQWVLDRLDLTCFCSLNDATYEKLTLEFLSYFTYYTPLVDQYSFGMVRFRLFNRDYELSQDTIGDMLHFPHGNGIAHACPLEDEWQYEAFRFKEQLIGERTSGWEGLKASHIHNPTICYVHRILANIIFDRINNGRVNSKELFFLHAAFTPTRVNVTLFMMAHM